MHEFLQRDLDYFIRVDEILWGSALLAITLIVHAVSVFYIARRSARVMVSRTAGLSGFGAAVFVAAILAIVVLHLVEVMLWAAFFTWTEALPNASSAFYNALVNYTTLGAGYLPLRWRLLEGMLGMAGLLCFAFSTTVLLTIAQQLIRMPVTGGQEHSGAREGDGEAG